MKTIEDYWQEMLRRAGITQDDVHPDEITIARAMFGAGYRAALEMVNDDHEACLSDLKKWMQDHG